MCDEVNPSIKALDDGVSESSKRQRLLSMNLQNPGLSPEERETIEKDLKKEKQKGMDLKKQRDGLKAFEQRGTRTE